MSPAGRPWAWAMDLALFEARQAAAAGDVPVGAVLVGPGPAAAVLGVARNEREAGGDPTAHAEVLALRRAATERAEGWRLAGTTLVVTLEPCAMCTGAMIAARVERCVFGAWDPKAGACGSVWDLPRDPRALHRVEIVGGVDEARCSQVLEDFFARRR